MNRPLITSISLQVHTTLTDPGLTAAQRDRIAALVRRLADSFKRMDPAFSYEWFYGACGLDRWGDLIGPDRAGVR